MATLVAHEAPLEAVFAKVADEVARTVGAVDSALWRDNGDGTVTAAAAQGPNGALGVSVGTRLSLDGDSVIAVVLGEGRPHRIDDYAPLAGSVAERARELGMRSAVGCPIVVGSRTWGAMTVATYEAVPYEAEPFAPETETRVARFSDLVATAIANAEARAEVERLAHEQAALRRVATLVAQGTPSDALFRAVCGEVQALARADASAVIRFEADGTVTLMGASNATRHSVGARLELDPEFVVAEVHRTGRAARLDTDDPLAPEMSEVVRAERVRSVVASPIVVEGELWGAITTASRERPLAAGTERRLADFTELVATAIANTLARQQVTALAQEQAALRRVATLVATEASPAEVFAQVAEEVTRTFADVQCLLFRDEGDGTATAIAVCGAGVSGRVPLGEPMPLHPAGVIQRVFREGRPSRIDDYSAVPAPLAEETRDRGVGSAVGCPIVVGERTWGAMVVAAHDAGALPPETETRMAQFADLVATAVANADARAEVERLAEEQAALRRVATLVATGSAPDAVFDAVAAEMERLLGADQVSLGRYEAGEEITVVADRGTGASRLPLGSRFRLSEQSVTATVRRTGRPGRIEDFTWADGPIAAMVRANGLRVSVGAPIVVDGALWGVISAGWGRAESPPDDTEERMARFAELLDTAIANADSRDQLTASRARLVAAGDEARRRVVRDLHDGAQQRLVHTIVALKLAQRALETQDGRAESIMAEALAHAEKSNEELRELAHGILPAVLTRGGLPAAVRARCDPASAAGRPRPRDRTRPG